MIRLTIELPDGDPAAESHVGRITVDALAAGARVWTVLVDRNGQLVQHGPDVSAAAPEAVPS